MHMDNVNLVVNVIEFRIKLTIAGSQGILCCLLHWSPKFYNNVFFDGLTTLGTFIEV